MLGNPHVLRIVDEERGRLDVETQSIVIPEICERVAPYVAPENHLHISAAVKELLREYLRPKCGNANLNIPDHYKNWKLGGERKRLKGGKLAPSRQDKSVSGMNFTSGPVSERQGEVTSNEISTAAPVSGAVSTSNITEAHPTLTSADVDSGTSHLSFALGIIHTTSNWLSGGHGGLSVGQVFLDSNNVDHDATVDTSVSAGSGITTSLSGASREVGEVPIDLNEGSERVAPNDLSSSTSGSQAQQAPNEPPRGRDGTAINASMENEGGEVKPKEPSIHTGPENPDPTSRSEADQAADKLRPTTSDCSGPKTGIFLGIVHRNSGQSSSRFFGF